jgi:mutator protein MutT
MTYMLVAAAVIEEKGAILIGRRKGGRFAGLWEFPGGKVEPGETPEECLKRELREELDVEAEIGGLFLSVRHVYSHAPVELLVYRARIVAGEPSLHDHDELRWVRPEDLSSYEFPAADLPVVLRLAGDGLDT